MRSKHQHRLGNGSGLGRQKQKLQGFCCLEIGEQRCGVLPLEEQGLVQVPGHLQVPAPRAQEGRGHRAGGANAHSQQLHPARKPLRHAQLDATCEVSPLQPQLHNSKYPAGLADWKHGPKSILLWNPNDTLEGLPMIPGRNAEQRYEKIANKKLITIPNKIIANASPASDA